MWGWCQDEPCESVCRSVRHKAVKLEEYTKEDGKISMVNINFIHSNAKSQCIIAKLKTSIYHNSANISYKIDMDRNSNILPFCTYKILFPRSMKKLLSQAENKNSKLKTYNNKVIRQLGSYFITLKT